MDNTLATVFLDRSREYLDVEYRKKLRLAVRALPPSRLSERTHIQGRDLVVLDAIYHVVEHFSYHLGQIVWVSKVVSPGTVHFYEDAGGLARPLWNQ